MVRSYFERGPARFFKAVPAPIRPLVKLLVRRKMRSALYSQGAGRYTQTERTLLADRSFESISTILGDQRYLMGEKPCGADATVFAFVPGSLCPVFETALSEKAGAYPNLVSYCERLGRVPRRGVTATSRSGVTAARIASRPR
jgi:glutathione S-transferase